MAEDPKTRFLNQDHWMCVRLTGRMKAFDDLYCYLQNRDGASNAGYRSVSPRALC